MGIKISNLPVIVTPAMSDVIPVVQSGVTYKESMTQLSSLFATAGANSNITSLSGLTTPLSISQGGTGLIAFGTGVQTALGVNVNGSGAISLTTSPTFVTPVLGAASATSLSFSSTSGIIGTTTNNNAAAGSVGEFKSSVIASGSAVSITTNTATNLTSIDLTSGDWNVWGNLTFLVDVTTTISSTIAWVSSTSATVPDISLVNSTVYNSFAPGAGGHAGNTAPMQRFSVPAATTTTVYISGWTAFAVSTMTFCGGIYARRMR